MHAAIVNTALTTKAPKRRKGQIKPVTIGHLRHFQKSPAKPTKLSQKESVKCADGLDLSSHLILYKHFKP